MTTSFFVNYEGFDDLPGNLPSPTSLAASDILSQQLYPESLHHLVWLGLQNWAAQTKRTEYGLDHGLESPLSGFRLSRDFCCTVFEKLQWSTANLKWSGTESLSRLDVDAFLYASVFCAASTLKRQREKGLTSEDRPSVLPADIADPLCTPEQSRWWSLAWQMHSGNKSTKNPSYGEMRALIQRGLEVIRALGNHGLDVKLIVLLAKTFEDKASSLSAHFEESSKAAQLDSRAHVYWTTALALLERMDKSEMIHMADNRLFRFEADELTRTEIKALLEEGRFFMACRLMRAEQHEAAAQSFNQLKSPYASFYQALMYKKMADALIGDVKSENITSEMRSNHSILLLKARSALHLTLDRLRAPHMHPNHPLNAELVQYLDDIEGQLAHIELNMMNRNACDGTSDDSASSRNSAEEQSQQLHSLTTTHIQNGRGLSKSFQHSTPLRTRSNADRSLLDKQEARPSPERLDAQLRHLATTNDTLLQSVLEQNRSILASNKGILEALEKNQRAVQEMQDRISSLQNEMSKLKVGETPSSKTVMEEMQQQFSEIRQEIAKLKISDIRANLVRDDRDEELYVFGEDEVAEELSARPAPVNYQNPYQPIATSSLNNVQGAAGLRRNVYPPAQPIVPPILPHSFYPQGQVPVPVGRNLDPGMLYSQNLMSCYSALGLPFDGLQQTAQQVADYSSAPTLMSLLYGNQQPAAAQPSPANVVRPQFTQMPATFGIPAMNLRQPTAQSTPGVTPAQMDFSNPNSAIDTTPHNYQISMPAQPTTPSAAFVEKILSPSQPISTSALLKDVPSPVYSAVTTQSSAGPSTTTEKQRRTSTCSEDGSYVEETECEGDYKPLIPLPEEVTVTTGEEDEIVLFDERAKLYRFVEGEWKERGVGQMKVLQRRDTQKCRILMRREQVHKVCANHQITADLEFQKHKSSENSLMWIAPDYAEEKVNLEKFCVRFKTADLVARFQKVCEEARELSKTLVTPTKPSQSKDVSSSSTMTPVISTPTQPFTLKAPSGSGSSITSLQSKTDSTSSPGASKTPVNPGSGDDGRIEKSTKVGSLSPFPINKVAAAAGEENETVLFSNRAELSRLVNKEWVERGVGDVKILKNKETGNVRLVMRHEQTHEVCANHFITADTLLTRPGHLQTQWKWSAVDFAEEVARNETFCVTFKTAEEASRFKFVAIDSVRHGPNRLNMKVAKSPPKPEASASSNPATATSVISTSTKPPTLFGQPAAFGTAGFGEKITFGGFTLSSNPVMKPVDKIDKSETDSAATTQAKVNPFSNLQFSSTSTAFGSSKTESMPSFSALASQAKSADTKEPAVPKAAKDERPLSELFKPKEGSWSCSGCYTSNSADKDSCPCCNTPKPGSEAKPASQLNLFSGTGGGWSFGIPPTVKTETTTSVTPAASTPAFSFGISSIMNTDTTNGTSGAPPPPSAATGKPDSRQLSLSELFKPKEGSWSCTACYTSNTADKTACICCETPKPGCEGKSEGIKSKVDLSTGGQTFHFGIPAAATNTPSATFAFGSAGTPAKGTKKVHFALSDETTSVSTDKPADSGFVFGASNLTTTSAGSSNNNPPEAQVFSFGSESFAFNFGGFKTDKSPVKSPSKDQTSGEEGESDEDHEAKEDEDHLQFKLPVIPLPDKVPIITGEEDETVLYSHHAKLFRYSDKEWKERGTGEVKILKHKKDGRLRVLMRRDQVHKICLNHFLTPDIKLTSKDPKSWTWSAPDFSEGEVETLLFAIRFKTPEIASDFKNAIDKALVDYVSPSGKMKQVDKDESGTEQTTANAKPGAVRALFQESATGSSGEDEIEIVYESAAVTPEERDAALKLKLPANFYSYRRAPPCQGCQGCEQDSDQADRTEKEEPSTFGATKPTAASPATATQAPEQPFWNTTTPQKSANFNFAPTIFGGSAGFSFVAPTTTGSLFGGTTTPSGTSIFGGSPSTTSSTSNIVEAPTTTSSNSIFGGSSVKFSQPLFGQPKSTFSFGGMFNSANSNVATEPNKNVTSSAAPIFGSAASNAPTSTNTTPTFGSETSSAAPTFGSVTSSVAPTFGSVTSSAAPTFGSVTSSAAPTFGSVTSSAVPSFGSVTSNAVPSFGSVTSNAVPSFGNVTSSATPTFGSVTSSATPTFGGVASSTVPAFGGVASSTVPTFGNVASSAAPTFGSLASSTAPTFGTVASGAASTFGSVASGAASTFGSVASGAAPTFGSVASNATPTVGSDTAEKNDESIPYLPVDPNLSFAVVAQATTTMKPATQDSSNFQFAGAGSQVFGGSFPKTDKLKNKTGTPKKEDDGESSGDEGDTGHDDSHDPQYKPIIPLPDAIEVRTGEEDEEKLFCERAKVFRYSDKEWKERGIGEMKILYHPVRNSYRLLLRREQVYKVVLNQPLTEDIELAPMSTVETAWCWGGLNYAEDPEGKLEKLAVRFKNVELAANFKKTLESCQEKLRLNTSASADQEGTDALATETSTNSASDESNNEDTAGNYLVDPSEVYFESLLEEVGKIEENYDGTWKPLGVATAYLTVDPQGRGSIFVRKDDDTIICQTAQSDDDSYVVDGNCFEWTSFDLSCNSHRNLRIHLPSEEVALDYKTKLECLVPYEEGEEGEEEWQREE